MAGFRQSFNRQKPTPMYSAQLCMEAIYFDLQPTRGLTLLTERYA